MDHSYLYSTRIEKTIDEDQYDILAYLKQELSKYHTLEIRLINYFKGLPVSYPGRIISIDRDTIDVDVYPHQSVIMSDHRYTFIRYKGLKHDIYANVQYVNIKRHAASLNKLFYVEIMAERRDYVRLELDNPLKAIFTTSEGVIRGGLRELSFNGAGVMIDQPCPLEIDENIILMFMLHNSIQNLNYSVKTPARLVGINGDSYPKYYRFSTSPDKILDRQIAQFIIQRQIEIIQEIKIVTENIVDIK